MVDLGRLVWWVLSIVPETFERGGGVFSGVGTAAARGLRVVGSRVSLGVLSCTVKGGAAVGVAVWIGGRIGARIGVIFWRVWCVRFALKNQWSGKNIFFVVVADRV